MLIINMIMIIKIIIIIKIMIILSLLLILLIMSPLYLIYLSMQLYYLTHLTFILISFIFILSLLFFFISSISNPHLHFHKPFPNHNISIHISYLYIKWLCFSKSFQLLLWKTYLTWLLWKILWKILKLRYGWSKWVMWRVINIGIGRVFKNLM